ncbi:hypothetical protein BcepSauron_295 [Burkholderia phage BcepSauron]|uniref:Uncharacterized protein n=2 Tax=Sarumanvirus TaxID=2843450 RepID=A0A482MLY6_9CAUD|nr:hypothetical protein H1O16_gp294 [Burkholderia phage BcepSaruman]YP_009904673.1 hypothetical protein H1O17_gp295 [Burkholderia phage BcepSauron]QBQ74675.1 hypothetical protein BcepSauron_295 [Burkholderia phage BcepSauron]QBX06707.1 hypothetical protein BcepSaruman_294 [Burkholderia phage BcepSaruman]
MTPQQLKKAAMYLCALRGLDPNELVAPDPNAHHTVYQWRLAADEIEAHQQIEAAIYHATKG